VKLQIISDLHFEMQADGGAGLIRELDPTGGDVLILAGDITMARHSANLESVFKPHAKKYRHILYVPGEPRVLQVLAKGGSAQPGEAGERDA